MNDKTDDAIPDGFNVTEVMGMKFATPPELGVLPPEVLAAFIEAMIEEGQMEITPEGQLQSTGKAALGELMGMDPRLDEDLDYGDHEMVDVSKLDVLNEEDKAMLRKIGVLKE